MRSALHMDEASRPQVPHTDQAGVAITVAEDHIHHAARFISGCRIEVADHQSLVPGRALSTGDQETRGRDLAHLPSCGKHSGWNGGSVAAEVASKHHRRLSRAMMNESLSCAASVGRLALSHSPTVASSSTTAVKMGPSTRRSSGVSAMRSTPANSMQGGLVMLASRWHRSRDYQRSEGAGKVVLHAAHNTRRAA